MDEFEAREKQKIEIAQRHSKAYEEEVARNAKINAERLELDRVAAERHRQDLAHLQAYRDKKIEVWQAQVEALNAIARALTPDKVWT